MHRMTFDPDLTFDPDDLIISITAVASEYSSSQFKLYHLSI